MLKNKTIGALTGLAAFGISLPAGAVDPSPTHIDPRAGEGCWVRFFDEAGFGPPAGLVSGGLYISSIAGPGMIGEQSDRAFLRTARSLVVGPEATLIAYAEPGFRKEILSLEPGRKVKDLREIGFPEGVASLKIVCK
jgi:hypothetical protein